MLPAELISMLARLSGDDLEQLALLCSPSRVRARRQEERDRALLHLAGFYLLASGRAIAAAMRADLVRVGSRGARSIESAHREALQGAYAACCGAIPSLTVLRDVLAGVRGRKSPADSGHASRDTAPRPGAAGAIAASAAPAGLLTRRRAI